MDAVRALVRRRETRAAMAIWIVVPTIFLFFNLVLAVDPSAHIDQVRLGAAVLDVGVSTPQGEVSVGQQVLGGLHERMGIEVVAYPDEASLRDAVLAREVNAGVVVPAETTSRLQASQPVELVVIRSDANDAFSNAFPTSLATMLGVSLNAMASGLQTGTAAPPLATVATETTTTAVDWRFATMAGFLLLPLWMASLAFSILLSRAGDEVRRSEGVTRTGAAEAVIILVAAAVTAVVLALDIALFTWQWGIDLLGLVAFLWLALTAIGWLLLGAVRACGLIIGALLGVVALFVQQPISSAGYPPSFAPDAVRWIEPVAPLRYMVEGLRDVLIGGTTLSDMGLRIGLLALVGLVLIGLGMARLTWWERRHPTSAPAATVA